MSGGFPCICNLKKNKQTWGEQTPRKPKQNSVGSEGLTCRGRGRGAPAQAPLRGWRPGPHGGASDNVGALLGWCGPARPSLWPLLKKRLRQVSAVAEGAAAMDS
ncbi:Hypothetical predicted protein, partial [Marmota monax]